MATELIACLFERYADSIGTYYKGHVIGYGSDWWVLYINHETGENKPSFFLCRELPDSPPP